ncbi:UNKNOWN [Stylonychia lemnae]|uniref:Uncharacterized protein n=1 Tax=Stylonychia lemnae TaxID=5949 RepID=A0A078AQP8_STYLE|nr:UNKNOWN [Stylonychia lemnae]|eukprot:CDW83228.1 UNKNOWN [Stylonychia lemnae]
MFKQLEYIFCCGNSTTVKHQNQITAMFYDTQEDQQSVKYDVTRSNEKTLNERGLPTPMKASLRIDVNDFPTGSIIMGKTASDVDLIGLSHNIHLRSCEKDKKHNKHDSVIVRPQEIDGDETQSTTPLNSKVQKQHKQHRNEVQNQKSSIKQNSNAITIISGSQSCKNAEAKKIQNKFSLSLRNKIQMMEEQKMQTQNAESLFGKKNSLQDLNQKKQNTRYQSSDRDSHCSESFIQVANNKMSFKGSNDIGEQYQETDGTDIQDFLQTEQLLNLRYEKSGNNTQSTFAKGLKSQKSNKKIDSQESTDRLNQRRRTQDTLNSNTKAQNSCIQSISQANSKIKNQRESRNMLIDNSQILTYQSENKSIHNNSKQPNLMQQTHQSIRINNTLVNQGEMRSQLQNNKKQIQNSKKPTNNYQSIGSKETNIYSTYNEQQQTQIML